MRNPICQECFTLLIHIIHIILEFEIYSWILLWISINLWESWKLATLLEAFMTNGRACGNNIAAFTKQYHSTFDTVLTEMNVFISSHPTKCRNTCTLFHHTITTIIRQCRNGFYSNFFLKLEMETKLSSFVAWKLRKYCFLI